MFLTRNEAKELDALAAPKSALMHKDALPAQVLEHMDARRL